jgi:hypothetical protein
MKKKVIQIIIIFVMLCQTLIPSVLYAMEKNGQTPSPVYVVNSTMKKVIDKSKVSEVLKESEVIKQDYTLLEPIALFSVIEDEVVEEAYFPIMVQKNIAALVHYMPRSDCYELEKESIVKEIVSRRLETTVTTPLILASVDNHIIGKDDVGMYNFSEPQMPEPEIEQLFWQVDLSTINLSNTKNLYLELETEENSITKDDKKETETVDSEKIQTEVADTLETMTSEEKEIQAQEVVPKLSKSIKRETKIVNKYEPAEIDYTQGLVKGQDYYSGSNSHWLSRNDLYLLIKSKDGKYSYTRRICTSSYSNVYINKEGIDRVYYEQLGGEKGTAENIGGYSKNAIQFQFRPEYYLFYKDYKGKDTYQGKDLNDLLNWLNFWTENEISLVRKTTPIDIEIDVREKNTGINFEPAKIDYTQELVKSEDYYSGGNSHWLSRNDLYLLIKSKDGKYSYTRRICTSSYSNVYINKKGIDRVYYEQLGGEKGTAENIGGYSNNAIQFQFKPEYYIFYKNYKEKDTYQGKDLNDLLNWLNFWTENEISLVRESEIDLLVAQKNNEIRDWKFFKEGRTTAKDQYYSLSLNETTRLNINATGNAYKTFKVYNKQRQKYFELTYYKMSDILDLPAGDYYLSLTGINSNTTFQMTKGTFVNYRLSVDTTSERTNIYINNRFSQQLTTIYEPYHKKSGANTAVEVTNTLATIWNNSMVHYDELDKLFGSNHLFRQPTLQQANVPNIGYQPLVANSRNSSMQYIGRNNYYANKTLFNPVIGPQQRVVVVDDLLFLAFLATAAVYSAYVINTNSTDINLTMPQVQLPDMGNWLKIDSEIERTELDKAIKDGLPAKKHKVIPNEEKKNFRGDGEPNSSQDLLNPDGSVKRRRYYDADGKALEDIDYNHSDDGTHDFPHRHEWDWSKNPPRQKEKKD